MDTRELAWRCRLKSNGNVTSSRTLRRSISAGAADPPLGKKRAAYAGL